jgi:hypothetical protein
MDGGLPLFSGFANKLDAALVLMADNLCPVAPKTKHRDVQRRTADGLYPGH